ncbi:MAG TPA: nucleotidyl transferase AbiEii/AbiGii toxin family protein [Clostridia bacterium]|nr:nucleotidyl transferase AbiEii/AbiGii toxin family protein [Clostridia bacterium]
MDRDAFEALLLHVQERAGIRADILEKDYYVTLMLKELAANQSELHAYLKGGTALYKTLGNIRRFSEDIDLTVETNDCAS